MSKPEKEQNSTKASWGFMQYMQYSWLLIPAIALFLTVYDFALNIPNEDDYDAILDFLCKFKTGGFTEKISLLFSQHNEHRILGSRIAYMLYYLVTGHADISFFIFLGNVQLLIVFLLLCYFIRKFVTAYWYIPALVLSICLFDFINYENSCFAMAGMQNYGVIMWFLLSLYCYTREGKYDIWLGAVFQFLCIFSSGNGMIGALALFIAMVFTKDKMKMMVSGGVFAVFSALYFIQYTQPSNEAHQAADITQIVPFFLHEVGGHFGFDYGHYVGGLIILLLAITFPLKKHFNIDGNAIPLVAILLFAFGSLGATAIFRSSGHIMLSYVSRYMIYNGIITTILFCFIANKLAGKKQLYWSFIGLSALILGMAYKHNYEFGMMGFEVQRSKLQNYLYYYPPDKVEHVQGIVLRSCTLDLYCIEEER